MLEVMWNRSSLLSCEFPPYTTRDASSPDALSICSLIVKGQDVLNVIPSMCEVLNHKKDNNSRSKRKATGRKVALNPKKSIMRRDLSTVDI